MSPAAPGIRSSASGLLHGTRRVQRGVARRWRRRTSDPFRTDAGRVLLVHCGHHKVGTHWFQKVLGGVAELYGLRFITAPWKSDIMASGLGDGGRADVVHFLHTRDFHEPALLGRPFRGSHLIRDPRDIAVSAYHYHRWTDEAMVHVPQSALDGRTYQQYLNEVPKDEGLLAEIRHTCWSVGSELRLWDYDRPEFLELRYEDLVADEMQGFLRLFAHYGLTDEAAERSLEVVRSASFSAQTGRSLGQAAVHQHLRSGQPGEWRDEFGPEHLALFDELAGDLLIDLGYEHDHSWATT